MANLYILTLNEQQVVFLHKLLRVWEDNPTLLPRPEDFQPNTIGPLQDKVEDHYKLIQGPGDET